MVIQLIIGSSPHIYDMNEEFNYCNISFPINYSSLQKILDKLHV